MIFYLALSFIDDLFVFAAAVAWSIRVFNASTMNSMIAEINLAWRASSTLSRDFMN